MTRVPQDRQLHEGEAHQSTVNDTIYAIVIQVMVSTFMRQAAQQGIRSVVQRKRGSPHWSLYSAVRTEDTDYRWWQTTDDLLPRRLDASFHLGIRRVE